MAATFSEIEVGLNKPFFTESDFCDAGGYWKSRDYVIERANEKVSKLVEVVEKVLRQGDQRGYPTTTEWHSICRSALEVK